MRLHEVYSTDLPNQTTCFTGVNNCVDLTDANSSGECNPVDSAPKSWVISRFSTEYSSVDVRYDTWLENESRISGALNLHSRRLPREKAVETNSPTEFCASHSYGTFPAFVKDPEQDQQIKKIKNMTPEGLFCEAFALHNIPSTPATTENQQENVSEQESSIRNEIKIQKNIDEENNLAETKSTTNTSGAGGDAGNNVASIIIRGTWLSQWYYNHQKQSGFVPKKHERSQQVIPLNFHPLPIHIGEISLPTQSHLKEIQNIVPGLFVASSDNTLVRLYIPNMNLDLQKCEGHFKEVRAKDNQSSHQVPIRQTLNVSLQDNSSSDQLKNLSFPLSFSSPIMALSSLLVHMEKPSMNGDYLQKEESGNRKECIHYISVGCQDGSIHIVQYRFVRQESIDSVDYVPEILKLCNFFIDGPIVSMQLSFQKESHCISRNDQARNNATQMIGQVHLLVGSLCGFACHFYLKVPLTHTFPDSDLKQDQEFRTFYGPFIITHEDLESNGQLEAVFDGSNTEKEQKEDTQMLPLLLWDGRNDTEDGILAVHEFTAPTSSGIGIAIGTYSGRILLYEYISANNDTQRPVFQMFWSDQLPYPIHGICVTDVNADGLPELLVTTRKSLHLYRFDINDMADSTKVWLENLINLE